MIHPLDAFERVAEILELPLTASAEEIVHKVAILVAEHARSEREPGCKRCGKPLAYPGAVYCGAACSAMAEDGE